MIIGLVRGGALSVDGFCDDGKGSSAADVFVIVTIFLVDGLIVAIL